MPIVAVIAQGEMGAGIARRLRENGARVVTALEGRSEASRRQTVTTFTPPTGITAYMPEVAATVTHLGWTDQTHICDPAEVSVTDPMLVVRRHVDFLRVRSAICRPAR